MVEKSNQAGEKMFKKAQGDLKTGLFKWSKDFSGGMVHFEQAAKLFKEADNDARAVDAHLKASECAEQIDETLLCAENLASAAQLEDDSEKALSYLLKANNYFKISGNLNRGTTLMKNLALQCASGDTKQQKECAGKIFKACLE